MPRPHYYEHLDKDSKLTLEIDMRRLAERLCDMNYGVHRLLSHLIDVRRDRLEARCAEYAAAGEHGAQIAARLRAEGDAIADGLEQLLQSGVT